MAGKIASGDTRRRVLCGIAASLKRALTQSDACRCLWHHLVRDREGHIDPLDGTFAPVSGLIADGERAREQEPDDGQRSSPYDPQVAPAAARAIGLIV